MRNEGALAELTLNVSNVSVERERADPLPEGAFVGVTVSGSGSWAPETTWATATPPIGALESAKPAAAGAGAAYLYSRVLGDNKGSVTVLLPRRGEPTAS